MLTALNDKMLRKMLRLKMEEVTGNCIKLRNKELHDLYLSLNMIRAIKLTGMTRLGENINSYIALVRKSEGNTIWKT